ncbi:BspA family leucine-rich repeat surface protein [Eggerthellaceae bacterium 24-137]
MEETKCGRRAGVLAATVIAVVVTLGALMGVPSPAQAAETDAGQDIYAIFYDNPDKKSYTLVIQNGNELDPAYPKPSDDRVILVCDGSDYNDGSLCGCYSELRYGLSDSVKHFTTKAVVKNGVRPHMLNEWFADFGNMKTIDLSGLDTSQVTTMAGMFRGCETLQAIDVSRFDTSKVTDISAMFSGCSSVRSLDLSSFDTSNVTEMHFSAGGYGVFEGCTSLVTLTLGELFDTSSVANVSRMFDGCESLERVDLSTFDTSEVTDMSHMFNGCRSLKTINLSTFDTAKVMSMSGMFSGCFSLESLDLSSFDVSRVRNMNFMLHFVPQGAFNPALFTKIKLTLPGNGDFSKADLPSGFLSGATFETMQSHTVKWRNEKGQVFAADAIPARTAGTYTAVVEDPTGPGGGTVAPSQPGPRKTSLASAEVTVPERTWTGKVQRPAVAVKLGGKALREGRDYTVSCKAAKNVGSYKVTVTGKGPYTGMKTATFKINPKGTSVKKLKAAKRGFTATWKKPSKTALKQTTGYQVRYSLKKSMKGAKSKTVKATSTAGKKCTLKVTKLKGGKKYYVQVRTYKKVGAKTYYSNWSKAKAVKTKR